MNRVENSHCSFSYSDLSLPEYGGSTEAVLQLEELSIDNKTDIFWDRGSGKALSNVPMCLG